MPRRYSIGTATVVMLVVLRLNIGWHFFSEGVSTTPIRTGPASPCCETPRARSRRCITLTCPTSTAWRHGSTASVASRTRDAVRAGSTRFRQRLGRLDRQHSPSTTAWTTAQQKRAEQMLRDYQAEVRGWAAGQPRRPGDPRPPVAAQAERPQAAPCGRRAVRAAAASPTGRRPLAAKPAAGRPNWRRSKREYDSAWRACSTDGPAATCRRRGGRPRSTLVDAVMTYVILAIGLLLLAGVVHAHWPAWPAPCFCCRW